MRQQVIKLVATDIDGTLIRESSSVLPEEIFDLIRELRKRDIYFAAASGRQYMGLKRLFAPVADQMLFISENGSNVVWKDEELYASVIDPNLIKEMQEYAKHFPNMHILNCHHVDGIYPLYHQRYVQTFCEACRN